MASNLQYVSVCTVRTKRCSKLPSQVSGKTSIDWSAKDWIPTKSPLLSLWMVLSMYIKQLLSILKISKGKVKSTSLKTPHNSMKFWNKIRKANNLTNKIRSLKRETISCSTFRNLNNVELTGFQPGNHNFTR